MAWFHCRVWQFQSAHRRPDVAVPAPLSRTLCINGAHWTAESVQALERTSRELTRNTLLWLGESKDTRCLVTFWIELTKAVVQMVGLPGDDITSDSIGLPGGCAKPLEHIKTMNFCMKRAFDRDLTVAQQVLPALKTMDANLVGEVEDLFMELLRMIDLENRYFKASPGSKKKSVSSVTVTAVFPLKSLMPSLVFVRRGFEAAVRSLCFDTAVCPL